MGSEETPAELLPRPWQLLGADSGGALLCASPHSGRVYPASLLARARLPVARLRRGEDAYVDSLLQPMAAAGVPVLAATLARAFLDLNRDPAELDPAMFEPALPATAVRASERVAQGLGVIPRDAGPGLPIYRAPLPAAEAARRILGVHRPFHAELARRLEATRRRHGFAVLLDWHSMPPAAAGRARVVLGDRHGRAAHPALVAQLAALFVAEGLPVAHNIPYAGAYTLERHARPPAGLHGVQIELDRALYLDPERLVPARGFEALARALARIVLRLAQALPGLALAPAQREAAE